MDFVFYRVVDCVLNHFCYLGCFEMSLCVVWGLVVNCAGGSTVERLVIFCLSCISVMCCLCDILQMGMVGLLEDLFIL